MFCMTVAVPSPRDDVLLDNCITRIAHGNQDAPATLYERTRPAVFGFALFILKNIHDAEDILQDTYLQVWPVAGGYRSRGRAKTWVMTQDAGLEAQANSISVGKAILIQRIQELNDKLAFANLAGLSVEELKQLEETGAPGLPIGKASAAQAAETYAGTLAVDSITWEVDAELDEVPHYEVELQTAWDDFEYKVDAYTGEVFKSTASLSENSQTSSPAAAARISASKTTSVTLSDTRIAESSALGLKIKLDRENGAAVYEVEFRAGDVEYEIDTATGKVLKAEADHGNEVK